MILIPCPHCGPRNASEFRYLGERRARPDPDDTDAVQWRSYLYMQSNPAGWTTETWFHRAGCGRYVSVERHTVTNDVHDPRLSAEEGARGLRHETEAGDKMGAEAGEPT